MKDVILNWMISPSDADVIVHYNDDNGAKLYVEFLASIKIDSEEFFFDIEVDFPKFEFSGSISSKLVRSFVLKLDIDGVKFLEFLDNSAIDNISKITNISRLDYSGVYEDGDEVCFRGDINTLKVRFSSYISRITSVFYKN